MPDDRETRQRRGEQTPGVPVHLADARIAEQHMQGAGNPSVQRLEQKRRTPALDPVAVHEDPIRGRLIHLPVVAKEHTVTRPICGHDSATNNASHGIPRRKNAAPMFWRRRATGTMTLAARSSVTSRSNRPTIPAVAQIAVNTIVHASAGPGPWRASADSNHAVRSSSTIAGMTIAIARDVKRSIQPGAVTVSRAAVQASRPFHSGTSFQSSPVSIACRRIEASRPRAGCSRLSRARCRRGHRRSSLRLDGERSCIGNADVAVDVERDRIPRAPGLDSGRSALRRLTNHDGNSALDRYGPSRIAEQRGSDDCQSARASSFAASPPVRRW